MEFIILHAFPPPDIEFAWRECLTRVEYPAHYNAPEYFLVPHFAGKRPFAVLALNQRKVSGVLTGLHEQSQVMCGLVSRPQICVDSAEDLDATLDALACGLFSEAGAADLVTVFTWNYLPLPAFEMRGFRPKELQGNVVLDLRQGPDALFKQFAKDRRRNIRFAEKHGVEVSMATTSDDVAAAYQVYTAWRQTERKIVQGAQTSFEVFENGAQLTNRRMFLARVGGKPVAVNIFRFFPGGLFESASNYSLDEFLYLKPNELLQWRGIEWACSQGLLRHSLGGAHAFLKRFGGTVVPVVRYRLDRTWLRRHDLRETVLDLSRETVQRMPPGVGKTVRRVLGRETH
jgi:CelD/BcsL family acetyltransferase involved in cellulose biosynthesis